MSPTHSRDDRVTFRPATASDAGEILTVQRAAYVTEAQLNDNHWIPPLTETLDDIRAAIAEQTVVCAVLGPRLVGAVRAHADGTVWRIGRLAVAPDLQGTGLGTGLLAAIEALATSGIDTFALFTGPESLPNVGLYERRGYHRVLTDDGLIHLVKQTPDQPE